MKISIITSVYNCEKYIEEAIESVLSQRGNFKIEYIVVDASSTDSTLKIIEKYKKLVDDDFYSGRNLGIEMNVISEKDGGMYEGIAKGFKKITGDVIAYINADDYYLPNAFSCVTEIFKQNINVKWLTGRTLHYNEHGHNTYSALRLYEDQDLIKKGGYGLFSPYYIQQESTFWTMELLKKVDLAELIKYKRAGDFYLWHIFAEYEKLYVVNSNLSGFRVVENQLSSGLELYHEEMRTIIGNIELTKIEHSNLKKIINLNNKFSELEKYQFGIFCYNKSLKRWQSNNKTFFTTDKKVNKPKKKISFKGIIRSYIQKIIPHY